MCIYICIKHRFIYIYISGEQAQMTMHMTSRLAKTSDMISTDIYTSPTAADLRRTHIYYFRVYMNLYAHIYIYVYEVSVVCWGPLLGMLFGCVVGVRCCVVGVRVLACCLPPLVGRGRLKDQARLPLVFCSRLLLGISIAGLYHHPPCPMATRLVRPYKGSVSWQQLNPRRMGSAAGARYERYKRSITFEDARAAGMWKGDRYTDVRQGYVKKGSQLFDGELDCIVRGASASVIAMSQGEGASSDGGSSPHEATARSVLLVSSDRSSYAAPSAGHVPDTRLACVSDNAIACAKCHCAIACARCQCVDCEFRRYRNLQQRLKYKASKLYNLDPKRPRLLRSYKGPVIWQQLNERIVGTPAHARYERYKSSRTLDDAYAAGMRNVDHGADVRRGYVKPDGCV
jgi:hypothetical protein